MRGTKHAVFRYIVPGSAFARPPSIVFVDTLQQQAIYDHILTAPNNLVVVARAGAGKTSTIERAITQIHGDESVLYLAFSKQVADEASRKLRAHGNVRVATTHSFGRACLKESLGHIEFVNDRVYKLAESFTRNRSERYALAKAVSLAKGALASTPKEIEDLCDEHGVEMGGYARRFCQYAADLLGKCEDVSFLELDFDDMIWLPVVRSDIEVKRFDRVFVDEVQDLNACQIELVLKASNSRVVAVGDPQQSIYGFRGADKDAMTKVVRRLQPSILPLSTTFRCAKAVVEEAQKIVPSISAREEAPTGVVREVQYDECLREAEYGDFILSRTNAPLVKLALKLMKEDCRVCILGRDLGSSLTGLVYKLRADSPTDLIIKANQWCSREAARQLTASPPKEQAAKLAADKRDCLTALAAAASSTDDVVKKIQALFVDCKNAPKDCVTLSTTHQAKGLERDRVWILKDTYLRPRKGVGVTDEEKNLFYVAITRARSELIYVRGLGA